MKTAIMAGNGSVCWGYGLDLWFKYGIKVGIDLPINSHCHAILSGASGSGKSTALLYLLGRLLQANSNPGICLYICDFKNSDDFRFLKGHEHYYTADDVYDGVMNYYAAFTNARENMENNNLPRYCLIIDEYPALISHLQMQDKINKTKKANDILNVISQILMLGRGVANGFGLWLVMQRPDSTFLPNGARDNFMVSLGLGFLSPEGRRMLFPSMDIPDKTLKIGEGWLLADGHDIKAVKYPLISNLDVWKENIRRELTRMERPPQRASHESNGDTA